MSNQLPNTVPEKIRFENHLSARVMEILFPEGYDISSPESLEALKTAWTENLKKWHSPYTALFDARKFTVAPEQKEPFERTVKFFKNFFMRKVVGFCDEQDSRTDLPFEVIPGYDAAAKNTGLARGGGLVRDLADLRSRVQIDNDFNAHVIEVSFLAETFFETPADVEILRSKMQNILMMWHSPYSVLFNCVNMGFSPEAKVGFVRTEKFLKSFFCKEIIGYANKFDKDTYPFKTYRSRHAAAGALEHSGIDSGAVANCSTRASPPK